MCFWDDHVLRKTRKMWGPRILINPTVDGRNPAPPKKTRNGDSPANTNRFQSGAGFRPSTVWVACVLLMYPFLGGFEGKPRGTPPVLVLDPLQLGGYAQSGPQATHSASGPRLSTRGGSRACRAAPRGEFSRETNKEITTRSVRLHQIPVIFRV